MTEHDTLDAPLDRRCPQTGDTVLYEVAEDWHPELGVRTYPAIVLYPTNPLTRDLDVIVLTGIEPPYPARWVPEGEGPGTWRIKPGAIYAG